MTWQSATTVTGRGTQTDSPNLHSMSIVRVRDFDGRWLAVADIAGEKEMGSAQRAGRARCQPRLIWTRADLPPPLGLQRIRRYPTAR